MHMPTAAEINQWAKPEFLDDIQDPRRKLDAEFYWEQFRAYQRGLKIPGVSPLKGGINDTPVKAAHMVDGYKGCSSYADIEKVDRRTLGLLPSEKPTDLVELHDNHKGRQRPGGKEEITPLLSIGYRGGPKQRMELKRTYYEEWFAWKKANRVRYAKVDGDEETTYNIVVSDALSKEDWQRLSSLVSEMRSFASGASQAVGSGPTNEII